MSEPSISKAGAQAGALYIARNFDKIAGEDKLISKEELMKFKTEVKSEAGKAYIEALLDNNSKLFEMNRNVFQENLIFQAKGISIADVAILTGNDKQKEQYPDGLWMMEENAAKKDLKRCSEFLEEFKTSPTKDINAIELEQMSSYFNDDKNFVNMFEYKIDEERSDAFLNNLATFLEKKGYISNKEKSYSKDSKIQVLHYALANYQRSVGLPTTDSIFGIKTRNAIIKDIEEMNPTTTSKEETPITLPQNNIVDPAPIKPTNSIRITIKKGDTLSQIYKKNGGKNAYGYDLNKFIANTRNLHSPSFNENILRIGDSILIPEPKRK